LRFASVYLMGKRLGLATALMTNSKPYILSLSSPSALETALCKATERLKEGGLVGVPTETVYGLAADATNARAVAGIYALKGRPSFNPLILHCSNLEQAQSFGIFSEAALKLANAFWPGPLTFVVPKQSDTAVADIATAGLDSVALRVTEHPVMRDLAHRVGAPLAAPSANKSGSLSPTTARAVHEQFGDALPLILDGGPCKVGVESTVVACLDGEICILRHGGLAAEVIATTIGDVVLNQPIEKSEKIRSPGATLNHYAPRTPVRINADSVEENEAVLLFGDVKPDGLQKARANLNLSASSDLTEAAANLFSMLGQLDQVGAKSIAVVPIPNHHLGAAINDRIRRASTSS